MRKFVCRPFGDFEVDLDDPKTHEHLPQNTKELRQKMLAEIGYSFCYMNFWHKDVFGKRDGGQKKRVELLVKNFTENEKQNYENVLWYQEQIFLFEDEIENMC
jgi:hypothetical protein